MAGVRSYARLIGATALVALLAACGGKSAKEIPLGTYTAKQIYQRGEYELNTRKKPKDAAHFFSETERLYPYSPWAKRALIMEAYAYHESRQYDKSRAAARRYLEFYPADDDAAYAQYLVALSYYDQIDKVGRDQGVTFQALQALRDVIEKYPDTSYARSSVLKFDLAFDHLAAKEMEIGRYYLKRQNYAAAINRFRNVVQNYQTTDQVPEALERLVEAYTALGLTDQAQTAGAILGYNFRSSPYYDSAYKLLKEKGLSPKPKGRGWLREVYRQMIQGKWL
ncbi:competence protein ComL [Defluviimonas sp. 20V17]|uniref:Outer membrane protein assembly factor BamD n=1 Tax=Allgaiera indica TaxID=765699 RepID=A0AAN4UPF4_9RHOB|nr:outer membrane protein assembly factor BamD [Allgaiera indica]KDB03804.1 competence protein ComL [Defluviimonas sp. 20V17]GHE00050.1 outer membrane protein assembly factor BamD [Allgaiera indica]SDW38101.1 Beta-barrel assembly machine subunit BamD [Allgaiera indica]